MRLASPPINSQYILGTVGDAVIEEGDSASKSLHDWHTGSSCEGYRGLKLCSTDAVIPERSRVQEDSVGCDCQRGRIKVSKTWVGEERDNVSQS